MFKTCSCCGTDWPTRDAFLTDPEVTLVGYQRNIDDLEAGLFLFNHLKPGCLTTMAIEADAFTDLYEGPMFEACLAGTQECAGHCPHADDLEPCDRQCACSYVREVLGSVEKWPKRAS